MAGIDWTTDLGRRTLAYLSERDIVWLTTVGADGQPQPSPVWFLWSDGELLVLSQPDKPKLRNIGRNPKVALNFDSGPGGGDVTILTGTAHLAGGAMSADEREEYDAKYGSAIARLGSTLDQFHGAYSVPFRVAPETLRGF